MAVIQSTPTLYQSDVFGIYDDDFSEVFTGAVAIKASVNDETKYMQHPTVRGNQRADHKVDLPITIQINFILNAENYRNVYNQILQAKNSAAVFSVQTKVATYRNMVFTSIPHDESAAMFNTIAIAATMEQTLFARATYEALPPESVANPADADTVNTGRKTAVEASTRERSTLFELLN